jgi:Mitochondrial small ribosomal subunit Rsm22
LRAAVDRALSGRRTADLAAAAAVLSERYRDERRDGRLHVQSDDDALAYLAVRLPATYAALRASFAAIAEARPDFAPKTALDVGAGPGTALWAVADCWPALADALLAVLAALDVNSLIREVLSKMRGDLENHRIMIDTTLSDGLAPVYANAVSMRQVMVNLIANAADAMGAVVNRQRLSRLGTQAIRRTLRAYSSRSSPPSRTAWGMGLSICRSFVEHHGGRLSVTPGRKHGSIFQVTLPITPPVAAEAAAVTP